MPAMLEHENALFSNENELLATKAKNERPSYKIWKNILHVMKISGFPSQSK